MTYWEIIIRIREVVCTVRCVYAIYNMKLIKRAKKYNKLSKGVWGMPRLSEAMKDVISCEKLRGLAHTN